jgi:hypothetical protein
MGPSFASMAHMLQMCFHDFAAFCAVQNCATMESGVAVLLLFFLFFAIPFTLEQI